MNLAKIAERAYEIYALSLDSQGIKVKPWSDIKWTEREAWLQAIEETVNANLWEGCP